MKNLENMKCALQEDDQYHSKRTRTHIQKLRLFLSGEDVRGDDLLKAGLWVVSEVVRRTYTPSFRRGRVREAIDHVNKVATKHLHLVRGWPGAKPDFIELDIQEDAISFLTKLSYHAPGRYDDDEDNSY